MFKTNRQTGRKNKGQTVRKNKGQTARKNKGQTARKMYTLFVLCSQIKIEVIFHFIFNYV